MAVSRTTGKRALGSQTQCGSPSIAKSISPIGSRKRVHRAPLLATDQTTRLDVKTERKAVEPSNLISEFERASY